MLFALLFSYCMQFNTLIVPIDWICEPCKSKDVSTSPRKVYQDIGLRASKMRWPVETGRVKFLTENEVMRLSSANFPLPTTRKTVGSKNVSKIPSLTPKSYPSISHLLKYLGSIQEMMKYIRSQWLINMLLAHYQKVRISLHICCHPYSSVLLETTQIPLNIYDTCSNS